MFDLAVREQELLSAWSPSAELTEELLAPVREQHPEADDRAELMRRWWHAREPELETLLEFCQGWRAGWRDRGAGPERGEWFARFRPDGPRAARFASPVAPSGDGAELTDSVGDELCERGVRELADRYAEFRAEMTLWRRHLLRPAVAPDEPDEELEAPLDTELWLRVITEGSASRAFHYSRLDRFRADAWSTGVFSVLPDLDHAVVLAATRGEDMRDRGPALTAEVSWQADEAYVLADLYLHTTLLRPVNDAALRSLSADGARCFYFQFDDAVLFSANGAFAGVPLGMLTALRIAAGAREDGGPFRLPTVGTEVSQIVRGGSALTVHPSRFCRDGYDTVRALVARLHPHADVRRGWGG